MSITAVDVHIVATHELRNGAQLIAQVIRIHAGAEKCVGDDRWIISWPLPESCWLPGSDPEAEVEKMYDGLLYTNAERLKQLVLPSSASSSDYRAKARIDELPPDTLIILQPLP